MRSKSSGVLRVPSGDGGGSRRAGTGAPGPGAGAASPGQRGRPDALSLFLDVLALGLAASYLVRLWHQAAPATFSSDECFHAYLSEWIARRGRLPRELPEFYSGLPYFYPPLFHLVGAVAVRLAGPESLKFLNVVLTGALLGMVYALPVPGLSRAARRCTVLLCLASPALSLFAVRFYAETLSTLLAVLVVMLLMRARARPTVREGVLLGVAVGAGLLSKQSAPVLPVLLAALAAIDLVRGRRPQATTMLIALLTGLAVGLPFFVRNAILFGGPFFPPITSDAQVALHAMNDRVFGLPAPRFYRAALDVMRPIVPWLAAAAIAWNLFRGRFNLTTGLLAGCVAFVLLGPFLPLFQPRHLNPVTAMLALLGSLVLADALAPRRWVSFAAQLLLIGWGFLFVDRMTGMRRWFNPTPTDREAYQAIAEFVPPGRTVLSRNTYDTFYHGHRYATWPIPWGATANQLELFNERDPDRFLASLDRLAIGHLLLPRRTPDRDFNGANFSESFVDCVANLVERGRLRVLWGSADLVLVARAEDSSQSGEPGRPDAPTRLATRTTARDR